MFSPSTGWWRGERSSKLKWPLQTVHQLLTVCLSVQWWSSCRYFTEIINSTSMIIQRFIQLFQRSLFLLILHNTCKIQRPLTDWSVISFVRLLPLYPISPFCLSTINLSLEFYCYCAGSIRRPSPLKKTTNVTGQLLPFPLLCLHQQSFQIIHMWSFE